MNTTTLEPEEAVFPSAALDHLDTLLDQAQELEMIRAKLESGKPVTLAIAQEAHRALSKPIIRTIMKGSPEYRIAMEEMNGGVIAIGATILAALLAVIYAILRFIKPDSGGSGGGSYSNTMWPPERYEAAGKNAAHINVKGPMFRVILKEVSVGNMTALKKDTNLGAIEAQILFSSSYTANFKALFDSAQHVPIERVLRDIEEVEKALFAFGQDLKQEMAKGPLSDEMNRTMFAQLKGLQAMADRTYDTWKAQDAEEAVRLEMFEHDMKKPLPELEYMRLVNGFKSWEQNCTVRAVMAFSKDMEARRAHFEKLADETKARQDQLSELSKVQEIGSVMMHYIQTFRKVMYQRGLWASRQAHLVRHMINHQRGLMRAAKLLAKYLEEAIKSYEQRLKGKDEYDERTVKEAKEAITELHRFAKEPGKLIL